MKKWIKFLIIVVCSFVFCVGIDILSIYTRNKPIFIIKNDNCDCLNKVYYGILYDTYNCFTESMVHIKPKGSKYSCKVINSNLYIGKIKEINSKYLVIEGISNDNNLGYGLTAEVSLNNNTLIKGADNLIVGQTIKLNATSVEETYPSMIDTDEIEVIYSPNLDEDIKLKIEIDSLNLNELKKIIEIDNYSIYYYGINSSKIIIGKEEYDFAEAIKNGIVNIDEVVMNLKLSDVFRDGETTIYKDGGTSRFESDEYTIIKCNKIIDLGIYNKDIYIGNKNMKYEENYCK